MDRQRTPPSSDKSISRKLAAGKCGDEQPQEDAAEAIKAIVAGQVGMIMRQGMAKARATNNKIHKWRGDDYRGKASFHIWI